MRDRLGRFVEGHKVLAPRDKETGCFISAAEFKYRRAVSEIDYFLDSRRAS